jgi:hypothetical protein
VPREIAAPLKLANVSTDPSDADAGCMWYRTNTAEYFGDDGLAGRKLKIGPFGNVPVVFSTKWHSLPAYGAPSAVAIVLNRAYAIPFWPGRSTTITGVAAEVTVLGVGNLRAGLYTASPATGAPNTLIADWGTVSTGLAGVKTWTVSQAVRPVLYWLVLAQQGLVALSLRSRDTWDPIVSDDTPVLNANRNTYYRDTGFGGAFPASFGTPDGSVQGPSAMLQLT